MSDEHTAELASNLTETMTGEGAPDQAQLSKVLFPDTHTDSVVLLGKPRTLRPVTVKVAKKMYAALQDFSRASQDAIANQVKTPLNDIGCTSLFSVAAILADFYGWDDVASAAAEEDLSISELQALALAQQNLNGTNDFLLGPLRHLILICQIQETMQLKASNLLFRSMSSMLPSVENGDAPSST